MNYGVGVPQGVPTDQSMESSKWTKRSWKKSIITDSNATPIVYPQSVKFIIYSALNRLTPNPKGRRVSK